jgi:hypothetical protein
MWFPAKLHLERTRDDASKGGIICRIDVFGNSDRAYMRSMLLLVLGLNMLFCGARKLNMLFFGANKCCFLVRKNVLKWHLEHIG